MAWGWGKEERGEDRGLGDLVNPGSERCSTRRVVSSSCRTEEVEPGRFVRKCDKTEQILRACAGRPVEVVESKNEHTEVDVTDEVTKGAIPFEPSTVEPFTFPGLRSDMEAIEQGLLGGLNNFMEAAEEMTNEFFRSFNVPSHHDRESSLFGRWKPADRLQEKDNSQPKDESPYSELGGELTDV